jgi:hypothetical protein
VCPNGERSESLWNDVAATEADADALYRGAFIHAAGLLGIRSSVARSLVEALSGRNFHDCGWLELQLALELLQLICERLLMKNRNCRGVEPSDAARNGTGARKDSIGSDRAAGDEGWELRWNAI